MEKPWGAGLLAMLRKATANQTANRYQSIQEFWEEFARLNHFLESAADPEATLVRSRLRTNVAVEQATAQPSFHTHPADSRPRGARIIVELPQRDAQSKVKDAAVIQNGNAAEVAVAPDAGLGKKTVADLNVRQTEAVRDGRNGLERAGIKAEWLRVAFIILLVFALMGLVASTYFHFAEPTFREGTIGEAPNVNLRSEPGGIVVMVLPEGTRLRVYEERNGWARVRVTEWPGDQAVNATIEGWVSIRFIK
jgi:hypothetical protein